MALRPDFSLGHSVFNEFLYAFVGEEKNGVELTVLSALTRIGLDPWGEAARLSNLPRATAARSLASIICTLPEGDWKASDSESIADRLVNFLPTRGSSQEKTLQEKGAGYSALKPAALKWLIWLAFGAAVAFFMFRPDADKVSELDRSDVWSPKSYVEAVPANRIVEPVPVSLVQLK